MSNYQIISATSKHDEALAEMSKVPMPGVISLALEKSPSYLEAMQLSCEKPRVFVCIDITDNSIAGTFNVGERLRAKDGAWAWQKYFSDLRIAEKHRGSRLLFYILKYIIENGLLKEGEVAESIIFSDNRPMISYARASAARSERIGKMPIYHFGHHYLTYTFPFQKTGGMRQSEIFVRNACPADLKLLKSFYNKVTLPRQGSHFIDWNALGIGHYAGLHIEDFKVAVSGSQAVGIMGAWDQTHLKRTRITGYVRPFKWLRPLVNFFSLAVGSILLPSAGSVLRVAAVTGVAIENNDPVVFEALLKAHLQGLYKTGRYLQVGMDANSPFKTILKKLRRKHVTKGQVFYVTRGMEKPEIPSMTRLEVGWI